MLDVRWGCGDQALEERGRGRGRGRGGRGRGKGVGGVWMYYTILAMLHLLYGILEDLTGTAIQQFSPSQDGSPFTNICCNFYENKKATPSAPAVGISYTAAAGPPLCHRSVRGGWDC